MVHVVNKFVATEAPTITTFAAENTKVEYDHPSIPTQKQRKKTRMNHATSMFQYSLIQPLYGPVYPKGLLKASPTSIVQLSGSLFRNVSSVTII